jgi:hypothetical protein
LHAGCVADAAVAVAGASSNPRPSKRLLAVTTMHRPMMTQTASQAARTAKSLWGQTRRRRARNPREAEQQARSSSSGGDRQLVQTVTQNQRGPRRVRRRRQLMMTVMKSHSQ